MRWKFFVTAGVQAFCDENACHWLKDVIISHVATNPALQAESFQVWEVVVRENEEGRGATVTARRDTGEPPLVTQRIPTTDLRVERTKWYVCSGVDGEIGSYFTMMLPEEY